MLRPKKTEESWGSFESSGTLETSGSFGVLRLLGVLKGLQRSKRSQQSKRGLSKCAFQSYIINRRMCVKSGLN